MTSPSPAVLRQSLREQINSSNILVKPKGNGYRRGERIERYVRGLDGKCLGLECFQIDISPGSGFAGQVYRAFPKNGLLLPESRVDCATQGAVQAQELSGSFCAPPVALKVLRPRNPLKEFIRDLLFRLSFQQIFTPRVSEQAVRAGLIWQELLGIAARTQFHASGVIARPLGYFWEEESSSFVEVHEWVDGRNAIYEVDEGVIRRLLTHQPAPPEREMARKKQFMHRLVGLCHAIGAIGLARQYEWYTLVSQANVLTRLAPPASASEFVAVDCRPGLAVPFFLPLSPAHARLIFDGLQRGVLAHFDEVDFARLDAFTAAHPQAFAATDGLIEQLKADDLSFRAGRPDLWHTRTRFLKEPHLRQSVRSAAISAWQRLDRISEKETAGLPCHSGRFWFFFLLDNLPVLGAPLLRLIGNERYRQHQARFLRDPVYRRETLSVTKAHDLLEWENHRRIAAERMELLAGSPGQYWFDKLLFSWLPAACHRWATDQSARLQLFQAIIVTPLRLCFDRRFRQNWIVGIIEHQHHRGILTSQQAGRLKAQAQENRMQAYLRDFGLTVAIEAAAKAFYLLLALYGLTTLNFLPLLIATLGPISPSGLVRTGYVLLQLAFETPYILKNQDQRLFFTRLLGLLVAPWRHIGNFFALLEMFADYNEMSLLLGNYYVARMINAVPVFGGQGKLLEYYAFYGIYNLPLAIREAISPDRGN